MSDLKSLGYITVSTADIDRWRHFAFGVLGFAEGKGPDPSALYLRMDERAARIIVVPGETDRVLRIGWEVRDHAALQRVTAALDRAAVAFKRLSVDEAGDRRVEEVITFDDPSGTTLEVFHGAVLDHSPVITPFGAQFVTGDQGLGHVVVPATDPNAMFDFYTDVLGMPLVKTIELPAGMGQHFFFDCGGGDCLAFFWFPDAPDGVPGVSAPTGRPDQGSLTSAVGSMNHVAFAVPPEHIDGYRDRLRAAGVDCTDVANHDDSEWGIADTNHPGVFVRSIYFQDPDGILLEFACWTRSLTAADIAHVPARASDSAPV